ncbi:major facilitator superfamily domain-containing protein [Obelidium mucronatum]|nr:major facilitator superfamily domain-containing protein [Obelidium mucronatum]
MLPKSDAKVSLLKLNRIGDVIVLGIAFLFVFTAFSVCQNMASTVLPSGPVAFPELGSLYLAFALFNLFGAAPLVDRIGPRPAMFFAALTYTAFDFSNVVAIILTGDISKQLAVLIPAAILIGIGAAVLWTAQGLYVIKCATKATIGRYTGVFFGLTSAANFIGPLLTAFLLEAKMNKEDAFKILAGVGALGPVILIYIWTRPEPANPSAPIEPALKLEDKTPLFLKAFKIIVSKKMLMVAVLVYLHSFQQTFATGSLALFVKTDSPTDDLRTKLYIAAAYGVALTLASFSIGPVTDFVNNPTLIVAVDAVIHMGVLVALWVHPEPYNNLPLLYPVNIICAMSDATLLNQIYKILAGLFPANSTAYAAYKFHASSMIGICFFLSKAMLKEDGAPNMAVWVPLLGALFVGAILSTWVSTRGVSWEAAAGNKDEVVEVHADIVGEGVVSGVEENHTAKTSIA